MTIEILICLLFVHWIADFVLQDDDMAKYKSKYNGFLIAHCLIYSGTFLIATANIYLSLLLGLIHFPVDYITSRINSKLYNQGKIHGFFVCVGFDQFIHMVTIILLGSILL